MWLFLLAVAVVVLVVLIYLARRAAGGEVHSVRNYQGTLATMEQVESRAAAKTGGPGRTIRHAADAPLEASEGPVGEVGTIGRPVVRPARLVFDDGAPAEGRPPSPGPGVGVRRDRRAEQHALASMNHASRQGTTYLIVLVLAVLVGAVAYLAVHNPRHPARAASTTTATSTPSATTHHSGSSTAAKNKSKADHPPTRTTTPTPPTRYVATSATATSATYSVPVSHFTVTVSTTGPCWVQATALPAGTALWSGVVEAGGSQTVSATGSTSVLLGATGATLTVNGVPVALPTGMSTPFTATFDPPAPASA